MLRKIFLYNGILVLLFVLSFTHGTTTTGGSEDSTTAEASTRSSHHHTTDSDATTRSSRHHSTTRQSSRSRSRGSRRKNDVYEYGYNTQEDDRRGDGSNDYYDNDQSGYGKNDRDSYDRGGRDDDDSRDRSGSGRGGNDDDDNRDRSGSGRGGKDNDDNRDRSGSGRGGKDDDDDNRDRSGSGRKGPRITGRDGIDPDTDGQDMADYGPIHERKSMMQSMDIFISSADDWEGESRSSARDRGRGNSRGGDRGKKYGKDDDYKKDGYESKDRKKRSYSRVRFPVHQVKDYRRFPIGRFPPLLSIFPWIPIFYDKITYQTFIFSPTGGIYILPPLINFYGQRFAVAQLIKWGYASLVSSGAPPPPNVNVAPLVQPAPVGGPVAAGVVGSAPAGPAPTFDSKKNGFNGGVQTDFPRFKPRYSQTIQEDGSGDGAPTGGQSYNQRQTYGGNNKQEVFAQGGGSYQK